MIHGDDMRRYLEAVNSKKYDYIIIGHTHEFMARRKFNTLVINPGAVTRDAMTNVGQTCAVLDVKTGEVEKISLA